MCSFRKIKNSKDLKYPELTAAIIFHHEWVEVQRLCKEFRKYYPSGRIILARDHLKPLIPTILRDYNPVLINSYDCMQPLVDLNFNLETARDIELGKRTEIVINQLARLNEIANTSETEFILGLEHDAKIRKIIPVYEDTDLEILEFNKYPEKLLQYIQKISGRSLNFIGWGFVVGVFSKSIAIKSYEWALKNPKTIESLIFEYPSMVYLDFLFPIIAHLAGGTISNHGLTVECKRDRLWRFRKAPLLHQFNTSNNSHRILATFAK